MSRSGDGPEPPPSGDRQSIVLITLSGLRPDAVGALGGEKGWTPHIDALAAEADWVGRSVVASSAPVASLVSLMTGLSPWHHQVLSQLQGHPRSELLLLAQALRLAGYRTYARVPLVYDLGRFGLFQGFDEIADAEPIDESASLLRDLGTVPALYWLHLREANAAFVRRDAELPRLAAGAADLPKKITASQLWPYADPQKPMPDTLRSATRKLFLHEVAWADHQIGALLQAVRDSGQWNKSWVIVTATQGIEFGEHGQVLYSQNLGRESIEVPLVIKAPDTRRDSLRAPSEFAIGQTRIWSTLVEVAGGEEAAPAHAPSLFRPVALPIVSELYMRNGISLFSLLDRDIQLVQASRFAAQEPAFYLAQSATSGGHPEMPEPAADILGRLQEAFNNTRPFSGLSEGTPSEWTLERWTADGTERLENPGLAATLASELRRTVRALAGRERTPTEESALSGSAQ